MTKSSRSPRLTELTDSIGARAIGEFGIDVSTFHRDMTSRGVRAAEHLSALVQAPQKAPA